MVYKPGTMYALDTDTASTTNQGTRVKQISRLETEYSWDNGAFVKLIDMPNHPLQKLVMVRDAYSQYVTVLQVFNNQAYYCRKLPLRQIVQNSAGGFENTGSTSPTQDHFEEGIDSIGEILEQDMAQNKTDMFFSGSERIIDPDIDPDVSFKINKFKIMSSDTNSKLNYFGGINYYERVLDETTGDTVPYRFYVKSLSGVVETSTWLSYNTTFTSDEWKNIRKTFPGGSSSHPLGAVQAGKTAGEWVRINGGAGGPSSEPIGLAYNGKSGKVITAGVVANDGLDNQSTTTSPKVQLDADVISWGDVVDGFAGTNERENSRIPVRMTLGHGVIDGKHEDSKGKHPSGDLIKDTVYWIGRSNSLPKGSAGWKRLKFYSSAMNSTAIGGDADTAFQDVQYKMMPAVSDERWTTAGANGVPVQVVDPDENIKRQSGHSKWGDVVVGGRYYAVKDMSKYLPKIV